MDKRSLIEGLVLTELRQIVDDRGAVLHFLRCDSPDFVSFGECYMSEVRYGSVKAWKRHSRQTQNIAVPVGRIKIVLFDDRAESPTRGVLQVMELGRPDAYCRLRVPPCVWYGFTSIGETPSLIVNCADLPHDPSESETCAYDSPFIPFNWNMNGCSK